MVHGLEAEYWGQIDFVYLDRDDPATNPFKEALGFRYQPEFYLLDGEGNVVTQWIGFVEADSFRAAFDQVLVQ